MKIRLHQIFSVLPLICAIPDHHRLCPVSTGHEVLVDGMFSYPIDIFDTEMLPGMNTNMMKADVFNCTTSMHQHDPVTHKCSAAGSCPLDEIDLEVATSITKSWKYFDSFCELRKKLINPSAHVRLVASGGSVTAGSAGWGCCCDSRIDARCVTLPPDTCGNNIDSSGFCSWPSRLGSWLITHSRATIEVINFGHSGASSHYMGELFPSKEEFHNNPLSSSDIVFLDHSVNDVVQSCVAKDGNEILRDGLEDLIRAVYSASKNGSWPTVILLEYFPWDGPLVGQTECEHPGFNYTQVYREVAASFNIPLWSYREFAWNRMKMLARPAPLSKSKKKNNPVAAGSKAGSEQNVIENNAYAHWLVGDPTVSLAQNKHPPWFIHMLYADLLGSLLLSEFRQCLVFDGQTTTARKAVNTEFSALPGAHKLDLNRCSRNIAPLLSLTATSTPTTETVKLLRTTIEPVVSNSKTNRGAIAASPSESWGLADDGHNRYGWVACREIQKRNFKFEQFCPSVLPDGDYKLAFSLVGDLAALNTRKHIISVHYLRSYVPHSGDADVYFCGKKIATLNSLWEDAKWFKFSLPSSFYYHYDPIVDTPWCVVEEGKDPTVEVVIKWGRFKVLSASVCAAEY